MHKSEEMMRLEHDMNEQPELQKKLDTEFRRIAESGNVENDGEAMVKAAAILGYTITTEEIERTTADLEKLDDDELEIAGGADGRLPMNREPSDKDPKKTKDEYGRDLWCLAGWHCYTITKHSDTKNKKASCWSNSMCIVISKDGK